MDRISIVDKDKILDYVDSDNLWSHFGGNLDYSIDDYIDFIDNAHENHDPIELKSLKKKEVSLTNSKKKKKEIVIDKDN